jgi:penicillin-binding protein 2
MFYSPAVHRLSDRRILFMALVVVVATTALVLRLWRVQVIDGAKYAAQIACNSDVRVRIPPLRGKIRDRNGIVLATNRARLDIEFYLPEMVRAFRDKQGGQVPTVRYPGRVHGMLKILTEPDIVEIMDSTVVPRLRSLGLPAAFDRERLKRHFRLNAEVPFTFIENADFATIAKFSEHDLGLPGVRVEAAPVRAYPYGAFAAHLLGYVGDPPELSELADIRDFAFYEPNVEGKANVEFLMDRALRGTSGVRVMHRTPKGVIDSEKFVQAPIPGSTVDLTIDARIQFIVETALRSVGRAGAVVVDPNNGEILALASVPSFDPNMLVPPLDLMEWDSVTKDQTHPLVNRAISAFPPGSTFKIVTALAGLREGLAAKSFTCSGGVSYGDHYFQCWKPGGHGTLTVSEAIKVSCNGFFYQYGNAAGIDSIDAVGTLLGFGEAPGTGLNGEQPGVLPGPEWLRMHSVDERWSSAYTANVSIGQGYDLVSPLQLVLAYSAVANGGTVYYPRLIKRVADYDEPSRADLQSFALQQPKARGNLLDAQISSADLELVREGFWTVVNEDGGTARRARLAGGVVAGKTGTAQAQRDGHDDTIAWFVCFAPFDAPRYAVAVMVQGGAHGGSVAAPIAAKILEETLAMEKGLYTPPLAALPPARHPAPFGMIESLEIASAIRTPVGGFTPSPSVRETTAPKQVRRAIAITRAENTPRAPIQRPARSKNIFERIFGLRR